MATQVLMLKTCPDYVQTSDKIVISQSGVDCGFAFSILFFIL